MNETGFVQPNLEKFKELVQHASRKAQTSGGEVLASFSQKINELDPISLFGAADQLSTERWYWEHPDAGFAIVTVGNLVASTPPRNVRFSEVDRILKQYASRATVACDGEPNDPGPRFFAAFSYNPRRLQDRLVWQGFPSTLLLTPRISMVRNGDHYTLTTNVLVSAKLDPEMLIESTIELYDELRTAMKQPSISQLIVDELPPDKSAERATREYLSTLLKAEAAVRAEEYDTIVVARQRKHVTGGLYRVPRVLRALRDRYPESRLVAAGRYDATFIGQAELPVLSVSDNEVNANTMSGEMRRGENPALDAALATQLTNNDHDVDFHEESVEAMGDALDPYCQQINVPDEAEIQSNIDRHYLTTSITARLRHNASPLQLLASLHPSPAQTGTPADDAFEFLHEHESIDRGWFSSPFGWLDGEGNAEFICANRAIAIREPLLEQQRAFLFTSTTVNTGIDPEDMLQETERVLEPLRTALKQ